MREANRDLLECMASRCLIYDYLIIQNYLFSMLFSGSLIRSIFLSVSQGLPGPAGAPGEAGKPGDQVHTSLIPGKMDEKERTNCTKQC